MHIHGNSMNLNAANFYSMDNERAAEARRTAEVRKRLLKSAAGLSADGLSADGDIDVDASPIGGQWMAAFDSQVSSKDSGEDEYHKGADKEGD